MKKPAQFYNDWQEEGLHRLKSAFGLTGEELAAVEILLASYSRDATCGEAFVLFCRDNRLYEVNASHDSSDGLEGQWEPEETLSVALKFRLERGRLGRAADGSSLFANELCFLLAELEALGIE
jgi:hypothetical protein